MRDDLGLSMFVNPEKATAREIARVLRFPSAIKREQFCRQRPEPIEYRLADDNPLVVGLQLSDLYRNIRRQPDLRRRPRQRDDHPHGYVYAAGRGQDLPDGLGPGSESFFRKAEPVQGQGQQRRDRRCNRMTHYLVKELQDIQKRVTVIDSDAARCRDEREVPGVLVIHGDGADAELLSEERITDMDAFVALTGLDETNIILAMYASQMNSPKVVAKINRESFAELAAAEGDGGTASGSPYGVRSRRSPLPCTSAPCRTALSRRTSRRCTVWWAGAWRRWNSTLRRVCRSSAYR